MKGFYHLAEQLIWVGQLGFSLLFPLVCCMGGCWWLCGRFSVGGWIYLPGIALGLCIGGSTFAAFVRQWLKQTKREKSPRPIGYNRHG